MICANSLDRGLIARISCTRRVDERPDLIMRRLERGLYFSRDNRIRPPEIPRTGRHHLSHCRQDGVLWRCGQTPDLRDRRHYMNNPYLTPERVAWLHIKYASVVLSPKYISIISKETWGGRHFSRTGWCAHASWEEATAQLIGENFRKAIETSEYLGNPTGPIDSDARKAMEVVSDARRRAFEADIARTYGYKEIVDIGKRCDLVSGSWHYRVDDVIILKATKRNAGGHSAWPDPKKYPGKKIQVPLSASDEELGLAIREAFSRCEAPGRQKINWPKPE
ncbi:hypothetical protein AA23498_3322 [Acetobacter nitrogenifigens DSM 23921 = NBRC 105050]|uniref:DUF1436 family protein n=2 Tax=Acetobacter nitrogenifigens TaxID=285268 RepID=A0A511X6R2_9PROT|nr:hypothetical protein AA23498_3322 [Acetobacter nitrogenifigens DSM 23921 = NBRC 105050]GEN58643.1 hypothetical protein ANI02nite_05270 [Acetobacter nitrogenifigens DSM 23921 = NBRC 105050]